MGVVKFGLKMLKNNFKQCVFYFLAIVFSTAILFNAYNIMNTNYFKSVNDMETQISAFLLLCLIFLILFFTFFANSYFLMGNLKQISIGAVSGVWSSKLLRLLCVLNYSIGIIGSIFGLLLGVAIMPIVLFVTYRLIGISGSLLIFSPQSFWTTIFIILGLVCPYVIVGDLSYLVTKDIKNLLVEQKQVYTPDNRILPISKNIFLIIYLIPLILLIVNTKYLAPNLMAYFNIPLAIYGIQGLVRYYIPDKILWLKKKLINNKLRLISLSNLHYSVRRLGYLLVALSISTVIFIYVIGLYQNSYKIKIMSITSYISAVFLIALTILYKVIIEAVNRKYTFKQLQLIGYNKSQMKKIISQEIIMMYSIAILVPLLHIVISVLRFESVGIVSMKLAIVLLSIFIGVFITVGIVSDIVYKKIVLNA
jgi:putative ABC transport system permease protein